MIQYYKSKCLVMLGTGLILPLLWQVCQAGVSEARSCFSAVPALKKSVVAEHDLVVDFDRRMIYALTPANTIKKAMIPTDWKVGTLYQVDFSTEWLISLRDENQPTPGHKVGHVHSKDHIKSFYGEDAYFQTLHFMDVSDPAEETAILSYFKSMADDEMGPFGTSLKSRKTHEREMMGCNWERRGPNRKSCVEGVHRMYREADKTCAKI